MEMEYSTFDRSGQKIMADFAESEVNWAAFCAMPDKVAPVKMPSLFPVPTHIVRRRLTKTIDANIFRKLMWAPEYVYGQGVLVGQPTPAAGSGYQTPNNSLYDHALKVATQPGGTVFGGSLVALKQAGSWEATVPISAPDLSYNFDVTAPLSDSLSAGGQRLIAAVIEIEYLGKVDNIEGIVEIAMNTNTVNTKHTYGPLEDMNFLSEDAIQQAPYYRRFRLSDGIRTIWFPMDEERFNFNEGYQTVDVRDTIIDPTNTGGQNPQYFDFNQTRCFIFPTKNIGSLHASVGNYYLPPGAHQYANGYADTKTPYRQDNESLHEKTRIEWAINFTGLTQACPVRVYINQYYETIPHESEMDNFFPTLGPVGHTDVATKLIRQVSSGITPTPSNSSGAAVGNVLAKIWEVAKGIGGFIGDNVPGLVNTVTRLAGGAVAGPAGSMIGGYIGNTAQNLLKSRIDQVNKSMDNSGKKIYESVFVPPDKTLAKPYRRV